MSGKGLLAALLLFIIFVSGLRENVEEEISHSSSAAFFIVSENSSIPPATPQAKNHHTDITSDYMKMKIWRNGDTWEGIAEKYQVDIHTLQRLNPQYFAVPSSEMTGKVILLPPEAKRKSTQIAFPVSCDWGESQYRFLTSLQPLIVFRWPVEDAYRYLSGYAFQPAFHPAVDLGAVTGAKVYAAADGVVSLAEYDTRYGYHVRINHANGWGTHYAHFEKLAVSCGQTVRMGDVLGWAGSTGLSTGPHLHFGIKNQKGEWIDPLSVLK